MGGHFVLRPTLIITPYRRYNNTCRKFNFVEKSIVEMALRAGKKLISYTVEFKVEAVEWHRMNINMDIDEVDCISDKENKQII